jgi:hypothetical protein
MKFDFQNLVSDNYRHNEQSTQAYRHGYAPCMLCGKAVDDNNVRAFDVMVTGGGYVATTEEEPNDPGWMGCQVIGADCAAKRPELKPYLLKRDAFEIMARAAQTKKAQRAKSAA